MIHNALTVDLESFIHREFDITKRKTKDKGFTVKATKYLLDLFDSYNTKTTFFTVGEIYEWYPDLVQEIHARGHEIAYHTHRHLVLKNVGMLLSDLQLSEKFLKMYKPQGFRAPRLFMKKEYLHVLEQFGFRYDSSIYGNRLERIPGTTLTEMPVSVMSLFGQVKNSYPQNLMASFMRRSLPYGSGLMITIFQERIQHFINFTNRQNRPAILFVHPWQFLSYERGESFKMMFHLPKRLYRRKINETIEFLLSKNKFVPLRDL